MFYHINKSEKLYLNKEKTLKNPRNSALIYSLYNILILSKFIKGLIWETWGDCTGSLCGEGSQTRARGCTDGPTGTAADCPSFLGEWETRDCDYICRKFLIS